MLINRRVALKQLGLITGGVLLLPMCARQPKQPTIALKNLVITGDQEALLAEVSEAIIPATDIPGAKALEVPKFVLRMVDDCYDADAQKSFVAGLAQFDEEAQKKIGKSFVDATPEEREGFLKSIEETKKAAGENAPQTDLVKFYDIAKDRTVQGFLESKYIMTDVLVHTMIPGRFNGCVEIKDKNDIQTVIG